MNQFRKFTSCSLFLLACVQTTNSSGETVLSSTSTASHQSTVQASAHTLLEEDPVEAAIIRVEDEIRTGGTKDSRLVRVLIRMDRRLAEKLAELAIARMERSPDERVREEFARLNSQMKRGRFGRRLGLISQDALAARKFNAIATGLLNAFIADAAKTSTKFRAGLGTTTVSVATSKFSAAREMPEKARNGGLNDLPEGIATDQIFSLVELKTETFGFKPVIQKHPVELILQITEGAPEPLRSVGYFDAFIDAVAGSERGPTMITASENPNRRNLMSNTTRRFFAGPSGNDGLLMGYTNALKAAVSALADDEGGSRVEGSGQK